MKKQIPIFLVLITFVVCLFFLFADMSLAGISVNINLGPPPVVVSAPPEIVLMPSGIYYVPGSSYDVFFYRGYWWAPRGNQWYRTRDYNGQWGLVQNRYVPGYLFRVPKNYRETYKKNKSVNFGQWNKLYQNNGGHGRK